MADGAKFTASTVLIASVVASGVTLLASYWTDSSKNREIDLKMIDVALAILAGKKGESKDTQPKAARRFAINALMQHSNVSMDRKYWQEWIESKESISIPPPAPSGVTWDYLPPPGMQYSYDRGVASAIFDAMGARNFCPTGMDYNTATKKCEGTSRKLGDEEPSQ